MVVAATAESFLPPARPQLPRVAYFSWKARVFVTWFACTVGALQLLQTITTPTWGLSRPRPSASHTSSRRTPLRLRPVSPLAREEVAPTNVGVTRDQSRCGRGRSDGNRCRRRWHRVLRPIIHRRTATRTVRLDQGLTAMGTSRCRVCCMAGCHVLCTFLE